MHFAENKYPTTVSSTQMVKCDVALTKKNGGHVPLLLGQKKEKRRGVSHRETAKGVCYVCIHSHGVWMSAKVALITQTWHFTDNSDFGTSIVHPALHLNMQVRIKFSKADWNQAGRLHTGPCTSCLYRAQPIQKSPQNIIKSLSLLLLLPLAALHRSLQMLMLFIPASCLLDWPAPFVKHQANCWQFVLNFWKSLFCFKDLSLTKSENILNTPLW